MKFFSDGDFVHKVSHHRFQGYIISKGYCCDDNNIITVQHWPEKWIFHFRADQLDHAPEKTMDVRDE